MLPAAVQNCEASEELSATRQISDQYIAPGENFTVKVVLSVPLPYEGIILHENLDFEWMITPVQNNGSTYSFPHSAWFWTSAESEETIIYNVTVPFGTSAGSYQITGNVSAYASSVIEVGGQSGVSVGYPPEVNFAANNTTGLNMLPVQFTDLSTGSSSWEWDFGDGETSNEQNPFHLYDTFGNFTVKLTSTNEYGSSTEAKNEYITVYGVDFISNLTSGFEDTSVQFVDRSFGVTNWHWDFGDGFSSNERDPIHTYASAGVFNVSLKASGPFGNYTKTKQDYIEIFPYTGDLNPWNDPDSEGLPDGRYITIDEIIEAYTCYITFSPAPKTGATVDIDFVIALYNAYIVNEPL